MVSARAPSFTRSRVLALEGNGQSPPHHIITQEGSITMAKAKTAPVTTTDDAKAVDAPASSKPAKLKAVPTKSETQRAWEKEQTKLKAARLGVPVEELEAKENVEEDWQEDVVQARPDAPDFMGGVYLMNGGALYMGGNKIIRAGRKVRLSPNDGRVVTETGTGTRIAD